MHKIKTFKPKYIILKLTPRSRVFHFFQTLGEGKQDAFKLKDSIKIDMFLFTW